MTVTAENTEVGVPVPAGTLTDRYEDWIELCSNDANGRDDRNTRVRLAAQGLERIGRREVGLLARAAELHRRPPNTLPGHKHAIRWDISCVHAVILAYRRQPQGDPGAPSFDLSAEGVWSTLESPLWAYALHSNGRGLVVRCGVVYITCTSSTDAY